MFKLGRESNIKSQQTTKAYYDKKRIKVTPININENVSVFQRKVKNIEFYPN